MVVDFNEEGEHAQATVSGFRYSDCRRFVLFEPSTHALAHALTSREFSNAHYPQFVFAINSAAANFNPVMIEANRQAESGGQSASVAAHTMTRTAQQATQEYAKLHDIVMQQESRMEQFQMSMLKELNAARDNMFAGLNQGLMAMMRASNASQERFQINFRQQMRLENLEQQRSDLESKLAIEDLRRLEPDSRRTPISLDTGIPGRSSLYPRSNTLAIRRPILILLWRQLALRFKYARR